MRLAPVLVVAIALTACRAPVTRTYGGQSTGGLPPPLPAGAVVPLWDHYCAEIWLRGATSSEHRAEIGRLLDAASAAGWELVSNTDGQMCFKRPHVDATVERSAPAPAPRTTTAD